MSCSTMPLKFTIELWEKDENARNNAGQPQPEWAYVRTMTCDFMPARAEERLVGRQQNPLSYNVWLHGDEDIEVDNQLRSLKDGVGGVIEDGPFNVIGIRKHSGWSKIDHLTVTAQKVLR